MSLRSHAITQGIQRSPNRAMLRAVGFNDDDFDKPIIGMANGSSTITPCNIGLNKLALTAEKSIIEKGAMPQMFGTITVSDGQSNDVASFTLTVNPVNDAPVIASIADQAIDEDQSLSLELSASDVDSSELIFSATNGNATITIDGSTLTVVPGADYFGDSVITVSVTAGSETDSTSFTLTVNPVNDAPILSFVEDLIFEEDGTGSVILLASDIDSSDLLYSVSGGSSIQASITDNVVVFTPSPDYNGSEEFTAAVTDGEYSVSQSFNVTIIPVNDAPVIASIADQAIDEDSSLVLGLSASDDDSSELIF